MRSQLSQTLSTNSTTNVIDWSGDGTCYAFGTFDGGTAELQFSPDGGNTWIPLTDANGSAIPLTGNGAINFSLGNCKLRVDLSNATDPAVTVVIAPR